MNVVVRLIRTAGVRLAGIYAGLFGLSVLILFGVIYWIASDALRHQLAVTVGGEVASLVQEHRTEGLESVAAAIKARDEPGRQPATFYLLLDPQGEKLAGNLPVRAPGAGWQTLSLPMRDTGGALEDAEDDADRRMLALGVVLPDRAFLLAGVDTHQVTEAEEAIMRAFGWGFVVTAVLAVSGGALLSLGFLRRVDAINRTTRAIIEGRLDDRVPTHGTGDELDELARNLNEMLDRVQALMESLHQVSSDIAHDLRTPLSRLRQRLEAVRSNARGIPDYEAAVDRAIADANTILGTFSALLRISQIESGTRKAAFTDIDLSSVLRAIADAYAAVAEDRGQTLEAAIQSDIRFRGDRDLLTQMLANLVENAIRHSPARTHIVLGLNRSEDRVLGMVSDTGPGIPPESRDKVFRRFFRLDRSRTTPGSGLGLSLVVAVADIHGISVKLVDNEPGLKVLLCFPPGS